MSPWLIALGIAYFAFKVYRARKPVSAAGVDQQTGRLLNPQSVAVILNVVCACAGAVYFATFNSTARFVCVVSAIVNAGYIIVTNYGLPKVSRNAIRQPLQEYFSRSMSGAEFPFLYFAMMFSSDSASQINGVFPFGLADLVSVVLMVRRSVWFLGTHGSKAWAGNRVWESTGSRVWRTIKSQESRVMELVNLAEVLLGFWVVLLLFTPVRNFLTCFVYWTYLRIKYMAPRSRAAHQAAWGVLDRQTEWIQRLVPFLERPRAFMVRWFNQGAV